MGHVAVDYSTVRNERAVGEHFLSSLSEQNVRLKTYPSHLTKYEKEEIHSNQI